MISAKQARQEAQKVCDRAHSKHREKVLTEIDEAVKAGHFEAYVDYVSSKLELELEANGYSVGSAVGGWTDRQCKISW